MQDHSILTVIKICSMFVMFLLILIVGSIPIRIKAFHSNTKLLSFTAAFSGGLFLSVGLLHLLPESCEQMENYYGQQGVKNIQHFPYPFLITILSFAFILWVEKIAINAHNHGCHQINTNANESKLYPDQLNKQELQSQQTQIQIPVIIIFGDNDQQGEIAEEAVFKKAISSQVVNFCIAKNKIAQLTNCADAKKEQFKNDPKAQVKAIKEINQLTPYILQVAIGIHAIFEGLAIGIEQDVSTCLGIAAAVLCHKWAEGLTLGLAFRQAGVDVKTSTIMIIIQAIMNPIGIGLGWILSNQGFLVTSIFESISAGTFIYIATVEVIVEEFNIARFKGTKFMFFMVAIGFVSSIWFMEQLAG